MARNGDGFRSARLGIPAALASAMLLASLLALQGCPTPLSSGTTASGDKAITDFHFSSPSASGVIVGNAIAVSVPYLTVVTSLVATFTTTGVSVKVGTQVQSSGTTSNDFTSPVTYVVEAADGSTSQYVVTVTPASGFVLTLAESPSTSGSVAKSPNQGTYLTGSTVSLTATPASGYAFDHWGGDATGSTNPVSVTMGSDKSVTAYFLLTSSLRMAVHSGDAQTGIAGAQLAGSLSVKVTDTSSTPVAGMTVSWAAATGGGSVGSTTSVTDSSGLASTTATLGSTGGSNTYTATISGAAGSPVTFTATAAKKIAVSTGSNQSGVAGTTLASPLVVKITDNGTTPVAGITVTWAVAGGGGSVGSATSVSDSSGLASTTATLGSAGGSNSYTATAAGLTGSAVTFSATAAKTIALSSGNNQVGAAGTTLGSSLVVKVTDNASNPVSGITVSWAAASGGGSVGSATSVTNGSGLASTTATLGSTGGSNTFTATATGLSGSAVTFSATAAKNIALVSGNNQVGIAGTALGSSLVVKVTDNASNPVPGITVSWAAASGGGSVGSASVVTDSGGLASTTATLGSTGGTNTYTATVSGLSGSPMTFTATAAKKIAVSSGNNQGGVAGTTLAASLVVKITDNGTTPVAGITVTWAVASGGGSVGSASSVSDSSGLASTTATLGSAGGGNSYTATVGGLAGSPVTFSASGAKNMAYSSGDGQAGAAGTALANPLVVKVTDNSSTPVSGVTVTWAVSSGGGGVSPATSVTDSSGLASTGATLGSAGGGNVFTASVAGLGGTPVRFSATGATNISLSSGNGQRSKVGTPLPAPLVVNVMLPTGAPVAGVTVTWAATVGGGSVGSATSVTDANGQAQTTATPGTVGANTFTATVTGLTGSPVSFPESGL